MGLPVHTNEEKPSTSDTKPDSSVQATSVGSTAAPGQRVQQTKSQAEQAAEKLYMERMEDEYAKREGGS